MDIAIVIFSSTGAAFQP